MIFLTLSALLIGQLVSAMPFEQVTRNLPQDVDHIAHDEANGQYLAYKRDGSPYASYPAHPTRDFDERNLKRGPCARLAAEEAKQLPGYKLIEERANELWGTGKRDVVTNPTKADQAGRGATACVGAELVQVKLLVSDTNCNNRTGQVDGQAKETNGTITTSVSSTYSSTGSWSVKSTSIIGVSSTVSASFGVPPFGVGAAITMDTEFQNEVGHDFSTTNSETTTVGSTYNIPAGSKCQILYDVKTCTVPGYGRVRLEASGWIWFEYKSRVKDHYKWALPIDRVIKNVDDRSSFTEFAGSVQGTAYANFTAQCN